MKLSSKSIKLKKPIILTLSATLLVSSIPLCVFAAETNNTKNPAPITQQTNSGDYYVTFDQKTKDFLKTFTETGIATEISEKDGKMIILHDNTKYLKKNYGVTDQYISLLREIVNNANQRNLLSKTAVQKTTSQNNVSSVSPNLFVQNWKIYFNQSDIDQYLFVAAGIGVPALIAALEGISLILGPAGPVITTVLSIAGYGGMANLCYLIIQSKYSNQNGIYFGINWNGIWPNLTQGTW